MLLRIKELCKENRLSISRLSEIVGITQPNMSNIANGKTSPSLDLLERIANALNVPISELFEKRGDFIAFVHRNGQTYTFLKEQELKDFAEQI